MSATKLPRLRRACGVSSSLSSSAAAASSSGCWRRAGVAVDGRDGLVAEAALGLVDDPLEGEVVGGLSDQAQVGDGVADLGALVEAEAADDLVGQADRDEALLELAGLELGADEDRDVVERAARAHVRFGFLADPARFLGPVPDADDADLLAVAGVGPQGLAEPAGVVGDQPVGGGEDVAGRAVVLLEPDDLRAGKVLLEAQDVGDLGAAPGIDRLVVVADAAQVAARLGEQPAAIRTGPGWCPDIRRRGCSGSGRDRLRARRRGVRKITSMWSSRSPKSQAFRVFSRSWYCA